VDDDELDAILVGGREPVTRITIADPDPAWAERFVVERERIRAALGPRAIAVEHIGSTSVPGLAAKPIIDVVLVVEDPEDDAVLVPALTAAGYELRVREPGHRMFRTPARDVHVHVYAEGSPEIDAYLVLRDRLRSDAADRARYEAVKRALAQREWPDMNHYAIAKSDVIAHILANAHRRRDT